MYSTITLSDLIEGNLINANDDIRITLRYSYIKKTPILLNEKEFDKTKEYYTEHKILAYKQLKCYISKKEDKNNSYSYLLAHEMKETNESPATIIYSDNIEVFYEKLRVSRHFVEDKMYENLANKYCKNNFKKINPIIHTSVFRNNEKTSFYTLFGKYFKQIIQNNLKTIVLYYVDCVKGNNNVVKMGLSCDYNKADNDQAINNMVKMRFFSKEDNTNGYFSKEENCYYVVNGKKEVLSEISYNVKMSKAHYC